LFYQSFMGWINYDIKQYTVSLIKHTSLVPHPYILKHFPDAIHHAGWLHLDTVICLPPSGPHGPDSGALWGGTASPPRRGRRAQEAFVGVAEWRRLSPTVQEEKREE